MNTRSSEHRHSARKPSKRPEGHVFKDDASTLTQFARDDAALSVQTRGLLEAGDADAQPNRKRLKLHNVLDAPQFSLCTS